MTDMQASTDAIQARNALSFRWQAEPEKRRALPPSMAPISALTSRTGPHIETHVLKGRGLTVTSRRGKGGEPYRFAPVAPDNGYVVVLQMAPLAHYEFWLGGRLAGAGPQPAFVVTVLDAKQAARFDLPAEFHFLEFHVAREASGCVARERSVRAVEPTPSAHGIVDLTLGHLGMALLPALAEGRETGDSVTAHLLGTIASYISQKYAETAPGSADPQGGLAPWQLRRCKEIVRARLGDTITIKKMASECRLSPSHFTRQFRSATGQTPHRWLLENRVDAAKGLLTDSELPIAEIALMTGFADQSHMTRIFNSAAGMPPGAWRRSRRQ